MRDLQHFTDAELAGRLRSKALLSEDLVREALARILERTPLRTFPASELDKAKLARSLTQADGFANEPGSEPYPERR